MKKSTKKERQARLNRKHKRAVIYIRYSSNMQRDGYSIEYQTEQSLRYIEQQGYELIKIYKDEAKTAKKTAGRDAFDEMMSEVDNDMFDVIVVFSFNRAFRNTRDALNCHFEIYENHGIVLEGVTERIDMTNPHGKASATSLFAMHELSSEITADHVKAGMYYAVQQGYYTGGKPPFGYVTYETGERSRYAMKKKYKVDEQYREVVQEIFEMSAKGMGNFAISRYLRLKGIKRADGYRLTPDIIRSMLHNRFYMGEAVYNFAGYETLVVKDKHPAIISEELFEKSFKAVEKRSSRTNAREQKDGSYPFSLAGLIYCGKCGKKMYGRTMRKPYKYYVCRTRTETGECDCKNIRCQELEKEVLNAISEHILNDDAIKHIANSILPMIESIDTEKHRADLLKREEELTNNIKDLVKQKLKGIITEELLDELSAEMTTELSEVKKEIAGIKKAPKITVQDVEQYLHSFMNYNTGEATQERHLLFNAFVEKVVINADVAKIHLRVSSFQHNDVLGGSIIPLYLKSTSVDMSAIESTRFIQNRIK